MEQLIEKMVAASDDTKNELVFDDDALIQNAIVSALTGGKPSLVTRSQS